MKNNLNFSKVALPASQKWWSSRFFFLPFFFCIKRKTTWYKFSLLLPASISRKQHQEMKHFYPWNCNGCFFFVIALSSRRKYKSWFILYLFSFFPCRNTLYEIYFGKTRDIVNGLRSIQPLADSKQQEDNRKALINALASKNVAKAE